ncbi:hypothetical protein J8L84_07930 [Alteromonas sp. MMG017]|uniref:hypothetical protein n=1 Tax=Alteromonas sp. MMG017 TaxID=2822692 RepID=UPI001B3A090C|nr:hypothetical protein [Alteromonas sp. MMG017]MBQ4829202.1 hypothetical protein [Alteromonas sp. MMG017]
MKWAESTTIFGVLFLFVSTNAVGESLSFSQKLDMQFRFDERSDRDHRSQYRMRYYPSISLSSDDAWSLNSFVVTGESFASSHNTFGSETSDHLYARRLYLRYEFSEGKMEAGIIPTYKGRVSSSGLSKDGWIKGMRSVYALQKDSEIELVIGELDNTNANSAFDSFHQLNYVELEYSAKMGQTHSYEVSVERMTDSNFVRGEYRWQYNPSHTLFVESVQQLSSSSSKFVIGLSGKTSMGNYPLSYFSHYSYVSEGFGPRAELTEDFLGTGHGASAEISGDITLINDTEWFIRADVVDSVSRLLAGIKVSFEQ